MLRALEGLWGHKASLTVYVATAHDLDTDSDLCYTVNRFRLNQVETKEVVGCSCLNEAKWWIKGIAPEGEWRERIMTNLKLKRGLALLLAGLLLVVVVQPAVADDTTETLTKRWSGVGRYGVVAQGVGMTGTDTGDIFGLNVPGTVVAAYLYWSGYDTGTTAGDDTVALAIDGGIPAALTADGSYGPSFWYSSFHRYAYWEDVTSLVKSGSHNYEVSGLAMDFHDGAGLIVVYENTALPVGYAEIQDGLDRGFRNWSGDRGETAVNCFQFDALATPRPLDLTAFVGGVEPDSDRGDRPNSIWYMTGTGATPTDMLNFETDWNRDPLAKLLDKVPAAPGDYALTANNGAEWDTYTKGIVIPPGDTWACFQLESSFLATPSTGCTPEDTLGLGCCPNATGCYWASLAHLALGGVVELEQPPVVEEEFVPEPGSMILLASGLAGLAGYATLRWRTKE
jgi:hypothetical protein